MARSSEMGLQFVGRDVLPLPLKRGMTVADFHAVGNCDVGRLELNK